jgi:lambda repressor-like predicted transcriptional regulator
MDYRLLKLILIDSYSPGRVVELPVDGGAVLTGRNGRGKTTLLQLIPIFYGEHPTKIVATETNRLDFNNFYLARLTSYIIFEYQRADHGVRMVILHSSQSGTERRYLFARSAYRADLFLLPDGRNILPATDLRRIFHNCKVPLSHAISSVLEYRSIIQGKVGSGKQSAKQRPLALDYAFVGPGHHLTHIEKIVSGMFLRSTNFVHLQGMVVSCVTDGEPEIALASERRKIASWPDHYDAYTTTMAAAESMSALSERESRLVAVEGELGRIHARIQHLLGHLDESAAENRRQRSAHAALAQQEQENFTRAARELRIRLDGYTHEAQQAERLAEALDVQHADWLAKDLPGKAAGLRQEAQIRQYLADLTERRTVLLGAQERISLEYDRLLNALDRNHTAADRVATEGRTALFMTFEPRIQTLEAAARSDLDALAEAHHAQREAIETRLRQTIGLKGECTQRVRTPQPDQEAVALRDSKRATLDTQVAQHHQADQRVRQRQDAYTKAKTDHREQEELIKSLREHRAGLTQRRQQRLLEQSPGETSLLHFLRTSRPAWIFDIAKVIREDLLTRDDLLPELIDTLPTLYGVGLDLARVPAHLAADEDGLRREIAELDALLAKANAELQQAGQSLAATERARQLAEQSLDQSQRDCQRTDTIVASARSELAAAERRVDQSRKDAAQAARDQLQELERTAAALHAELSAAAAGAKAATEERQGRLAHDRRVLEDERKVSLAADDREQDARRAREQAERAGIQGERDRALSAAGVDTVILAELETQANAAQDQLYRIEQSRPEVHRWQHWQEHEWPLKDEYLRTARAARAQEAVVRAEALTEETRWQRRGVELETTQKRLERDNADIEEAIRAVRGRLDNFRAYPPDPEVLSQPYDPGWVLEALVTQANANQTEAAALHKTIGTLVERVKRAFVTHRGTPPEDFYNTHLATLPVGASARQWVPVFKTWFDAEHDHYRRILADDAGQIAGAIDHFHRALATFHRNVAQFNRELQQSLDRNLDFESVTNLDIKVKSTIDELEYWKPIDKMAQEHRAWLSLHDQELPPPDFAATLRSLLSHWETRDGIRAELRNLIRIQGSVVENGRLRTFHKAADLERVSSNGLSYLILCTIFIAFVNRIRREAPVTLVWALDELKDLDIGNIEALLSILRRNAIVLVSAFPDPDAEILALFPHRFTVDEQQRLLETKVFDPAEATVPVTMATNLAETAGV